MNKLSKKYKEFSYTHYYRGIELDVRCVTTSMTKFCELLNISSGFLNKYAHKFEPRTPECIENTYVLYAKLGMGGEGLYVFEKDKFYTLVQYEEMIDKHRETYETYSDYLEKTGQK